MLQKYNFQRQASGFLLMKSGERGARRKGQGAWRREQGAWREAHGAKGKISYGPKTGDFPNFNHCCPVNIIPHE
jgi:hypothetical protein